MISGQGVASLIPESSHKSLGIQSSQKVGPSIAKDIKNSAYLAIIFAIIGIALYILLRFKNFSFSVGALVSFGLCHIICVRILFFVFFRYAILYGNWLRLCGAYSYRYWV